MSSKLTSQDISDDEFDDELKPGTELLHGQYVIEQFLNNGGFGITYLAKDSLLRMVVIKECFPEAICRRANSTVRVRSRDQAEAFRTIVDLFIEEARGLARLSHPNIVGVHQVFEDNETAYIAMDFVEGRDLLEIAETSATIEPRELEAIAYRLLDAVEFIHTEGVLHRDISPDNILLSRENEPVLIDFGAARDTVTRDTSYLGDMRTVKDGYSPQEFYVKDSEQHRSSDLYSLAASLYHVMCKELPVSAQTRMLAIAGGEDDPYVSIKDRVSGYSEPFLDAIDHALQVFPKDRIQTAADWQALIAEGSAPQGAARGPMLAAENGAVLEQYEEKERKSFLARSSRALQQVSVRAERPSSELEPGQRDAVSSQAQVARALDPSASSGGKGLYIGVAAAALLVLVGGGVFFMSGGSDDGVVPEQVAEAGTAPVEAPSTAAPPPTSERTSSRPEQLPFFLADSSSGDVQVSAPSGSRLSASDTGPIAGATRPGVASTASRPVTGAGETSELASAQPAETGTVNATFTAPSGTNAQDLSPITFGTALEFAVTANPSDPTVVATADGSIAEQLTPGLRVVSVNGFPIEALTDFQRVAEATSSFEAGDTVTVSFGVENPATGETSVRQASLTAENVTLLSNGVAFTTRREGDAWVTVVTNGAGQGEADLQTGDKVVALMPSNELIDGPDTLSRLLERETENGLSTINLAVTRAGEMWLVAMPFAVR
ncbi:MAG: serine/threonine-protein kinase [Paracoccaceae bacterium]